MDDELKKLMKELGEAINESLADSEAIAEVVSDYPEVPLILDPVLASGRGDELASENLAVRMSRAIEGLERGRADQAAKGRTRQTRRIARWSAGLADLIAGRRLLRRAAQSGRRQRRPRCQGPRRSPTRRGHDGSSPPTVKIARRSGRHARDGRVAGGSAH